MFGSFRSRSSRPSSERSSSSTSSQHLPQIQGTMTSMKNSDKQQPRIDTPSSSRSVSRTRDFPSTPIRPGSKAVATCLMQPFTVLSQSWCTNSRECEETVPQWVLDGAQMAEESPRSSIDSLESSGIQIYLDDTLAPREPETKPINVVCKAILASWRQANRPPRWDYEASPKLY